MIKIISLLLCLVIHTPIYAEKETKEVKKYPGQLTICPKKPNCVSSLPDEVELKQMRFLTSEKSWKEIAIEIKALIKTLPRTKLLKEEGNILHFQFTSLIFRFDDDVIFEYLPDSKTIHYRSSSRTGYSDLGANRKRMGHIIRRLERAL